MHQGGRHPDQLFGRCKFTSLNALSCGESEAPQSLNQHRSKLQRFVRLALSNRRQSARCAKGMRWLLLPHELPASGYALEVDGRLKAEFATRDGARTGAEEVKKRFPMLQIRIYDAHTKTREDVELS